MQIVRNVGLVSHGSCDVDGRCRLISSIYERLVRRPQFPIPHARRQRPELRTIRWAKNRQSPTAVVARTNDSLACCELVPAPVCVSLSPEILRRSAPEDFGYLRMTRVHTTYIPDTTRLCIITNLLPNTAHRRIPRPSDGPAAARQIKQSMRTGALLCMGPWPATFPLSLPIDASNPARTAPIGPPCVC